MPGPLPLPLLTSLSCWLARRGSAGQLQPRPNRCVISNVYVSGLRVTCDGRCRQSRTYYALHRLHVRPIVLVLAANSTTTSLFVTADKARAVSFCVARAAAARAHPAQHTRATKVRHQCVAVTVARLRLRLRLSQCVPWADRRRDNDIFGCGRCTFPCATVTRCHLQRAVAFWATLGSTGRDIGFISVPPRGAQLQLATPHASGLGGETMGRRIQKT